MRKSFLAIFLTFPLIFGVLYGQTPEPEAYPLRGKRVAIYLSKRQFEFNDHYLIFLSQFVKSDQGRASTLENLKEQTMISLGEMLEAQLKEATRADSVFFLNRFPGVARKFIKKYDSDRHFLPPLGDALDGIDYIFVINPMVLGTYKTSAVYSRSNRIMTQSVINKTGSVRIDVYDPRSGELRYVHKACFDEKESRAPEMYFDFRNDESRTGHFLARLFSTAVYYLNLGEKGNCPEQ